MENPTPHRIQLEDLTDSDSDCKKPAKKAKIGNLEAKLSRLSLICYDKTAAPAQVMIQEAIGLMNACFNLPCFFSSIQDPLDSSSPFGFVNHDFASTKGLSFCCSPMLRCGGITGTKLNLISTQQLRKRLQTTTCGCKARRARKTSANSFSCFESFLDDANAKFARLLTYCRAFASSAQAGPGSVRHSAVL